MLLGRLASVTMAKHARFYAVAVGRRPGVFTSWPDCEAQTKGFSGAVFKSFASAAEASTYVAGKGGGRGAPAAAATAAAAPAPAVLATARGTAAAKRPRSSSPAAGQKQAGRRAKPRAAAPAAVTSSPPASAQPQPPPPGLLYTLQFDGGSRGNPGASGAGAVLLRPGGAGPPLAQAAAWLGRGTNNEAEYRGLICGLTLAAACPGVSRLRVEGDSMLVLRQMAGAWKVEAPGLRALHSAATVVAQRFESITWAHIPRSDNAAADALANQAMDTRANWEARGWGDGGGAGAEGT